MAAEIAEARPEELAIVLALLSEASLPRDGVAEHFPDFLVAREAGEIAGAVGMERYGASVLLRSLVVAPSRRGEGLGRALAEHLLGAAGRRGARCVFLLTE